MVPWGIETGSAGQKPGAVTTSLVSVRGGGGGGGGGGGAVLSPWRGSRSDEATDLTTDHLLSPKP